MPQQIRRYDQILAFPASQQNGIPALRPDPQHDIHPGILRQHHEENVKGTRVPFDKAGALSTVHRPPPRWVGS